MPTFLPLTAINRSARVRIAGQTLLPGKINYLDIGLVDPPGVANTGTYVTVTAGATKTGELVELKYYAYVVTAVDARGNETTASPVKVLKTPAEVETSAIVAWGADAHAVKYRVYGSKTVAGAASEAAAAAEAFGLIAETAEGVVTYTDIGAARKTGTPPNVNKTSYNVYGGAFSTRKELQNHFAIGQVQQLGDYTASNLDYAPSQIGGFELKLESEKLKVVKSEVKQRSTGRKFAATNELETSAFKSGGATKTVLAIVVYNTLSNTLETVQAAEKTVETPTQEEFETLAKTLPTTSEILFVVKAKIKVVTNVTSTYIKGVSTPGLGDFVNYPVVASV